MAELTLTRHVDAGVEDVWRAWDAYGDIQAFNPNLSRSFLLEGSEATGLGALRQCDFADGRNHIRERIVDYVPNRRMAVEIYDGTLPFRSAEAIIDLAPAGPGRTEVRFTFRFAPKPGGPVGWLMVPLVKRQFAPALARLLDGLRAHVEEGRGAAA